MVSPFAAASWVDGELTIFAPTSSDALRADGPAPVLVLHEFARPSTPSEAAARLADEFPRDDVLQTVARLAAAGALVDAEAPDAALEWWEPHDLAFHRISRSGAGGTYRLRDRKPDLPRVKPPMSDTWVALPEPRALSDVTLADATARRCSRKHYASEPIALATLSALLAASCRNTAPPPERRVLEWHRPYASGGARYSLEVYPVIGESAVADLPAGLYHYCPDRHVLEPVDADSGVLAHFFAGAQRSAGIEHPPPALLLVTSRWGRVSIKYEGLAYSLVLKEVGGLFHALYLSAAALGLAACALGRCLGTGDDRLARACARHPLEEPLVGEFILGNAPPAPAGE